MFNNMQGIKPKTKLTKLHKDTFKYEKKNTK